jgi:hypothetical protein
MIPKVGHLYKYEGRVILIKRVSITDGYVSLKVKELSNESPFVGHLTGISYPVTIGQKFEEVTKDDFMVEML